MNLDSDYRELFEHAQEEFNRGLYKPAESILNQLILNNQKSPEIFHMLATIYYDQGKFGKAIRTFKRALEIDPSFTDASVGLSIIYNDLGKYEEGKKVFTEAKLMLEHKSAKEDPYINEKLSIKHDELGEMYFKYSRFDESLEQYFKALSLSNRRAEITIKIVNCYLKLDDKSKAIKYLKDILQEYPNYVTALVKLGEVYKSQGKIQDANKQWNYVLDIEPKNQTAIELIKSIKNDNPHSVL